MVKLLFFLATVANVVIFVSSTGSSGKCGPNESWVQCPNECVPKKCSQVGNPIICPRSSDSSRCQSKPACTCDDGYVRNDKGRCIPIKDCPSCGGDENAVSGCGNCPKTCANYNSTDPIYCTAICYGNACDCRKGFVLDQNTKKCVLPKHCTPVCGKNEVFSDCSNGGCHTGRTCEDLKKLNGSEICLNVKKCEPGCLCKKGYVRDSNGVCIPENDCPSRKCGNSNEHWEQCPDECRPTSCSQVGYPIPCNRTEPIVYQNISDCKVKPACVCDDQYVRNEKGLCVPINSCPSCGGDENAVSGCGNCRVTCKNYKNRDQIVCAQVCYDNACDCKDGYVLDHKSKKCVRVQDCPPQCSQKNEHWEECPNDCVPRNCSQLGYPLPCTALSGNGTCPTKPACVCDDGHVRNDKGKCIPAKQCPSCGGDSNAETGCGNCRKTCRSLNSNKPQICPLFCNLNGCNCKEGYAYDENTKKCVLPKHCSKSCGENEVYNTCVNGGCHKGRTCKELDRFNGSTICIDPIKCESGCLCKEGYVRNSAGVCIPEYECPGKNCGGRKNERWNDCPNDCSPKKCSELGFPVGCPGQTQDGSCPVKAGCVCDKGYVRNDDGICIPIKQCPSCGGDENAENGCGNCRKTCWNYNSTEPQICLQYCDLNGCNCKKGYVLDNILNKCVLPKDCSPQCGPNEELDECINGGCHEARTCKDLDTLNGTVVCEDVPVCRRGCSCKYGYLRDKNGECIPENKCPNSKCKGDLETYVPCNYQCTPERCDQLGYPLKCLLPASGPCPGKPACLCRVGYVRNNKGKCIPINQCPSCGGDPNATSGCGGNCGRRCSDYNKGPVACPLVCQINGCDCKEGYVYDGNIRKCVVPEKCTPECGQDEEYTSCIENCSEGRCGQKQSSNAVRSKRCTAGCICRDGFVRNSNGVCVAKNECSLNDKCSGPHEFWHTCPPSCSPETCASIGKVYDCPPQATVCRPSCRCAEGYKRNDQGVCILETQCYQCGKNETYDFCLATCPPRVCGINIAAVTCLRTEPDNCKGGCRCADGYLRNKQGDCVAEADCPPENPCLKANEVLDVCPYPCPPRVCGIDDTLIDCAPGPNPGDPKCPPPTCRCADGHYRDNKGNCVRWKDCPKCPKHEVYNPCPNPCPGQLCSVDERVIRCKAPPQLGDKECEAGCVCEDGYKRNDKGVCIPKEQCPPICPVNEVWDTCPAICPALDCSVDETLILCAPNPKPGSPKCPKPACRCKDGYKRNADGVCIPKEECPPKCPKHEVYNPCPNPCPGQLCSVDERVIRCKAPPQLGDKECEAGCVCEDGYKRNDKGVCIPKEQCPPICPVNEVWDTCPAICPALDCSVDETLILCAPNPKPGSPKCPKPACRCKDGYKRNADGVCIPKEECPPICYGANESWDPCPNPYDPNTCESIGKDTKGQTQSTDVNKCKGECRCKPGYYRNKIGNCISRDECLRCTGPHEYYSCGGACDNVCSNLSQQNQTNCPIINIKCNEKCYCEEGYARDSQGTCVPISSCRCCKGKNEWYNTCPSGCPPNDSCDTYGKTYNCPLLHKPPKCGKPICSCEDNYLRLNGVCVPQEQCPCNGDLNAQPGCGCSRTCSDYLANKPATCTKDCKVGACDCKEGYVRDENTGKCILPKNCPVPKCPKNEIFDLCPGTCPPETCPDGRVYKCAAPPKPGSSDCKPRCRCKDDHYRNDQGVCVPKDQCPTGCKGDENAVKGCGNCPTTCSNYKIKDQISCIQVCYDDACDCKKGFVLDENINKCVRIEDCTQQCGQNETYSTCVNGGCHTGRTCDQWKKLNGNTICIKPEKCVSGCLCKKGYVRNNKGVCIPENECLTSCPGPNESWNPCPDICALTKCEDLCTTRACAQASSGYKQCKGECRCNKGFYRNKLGQCISKENCLKCTGPHEYFSCGGACDNVCATLSKQNQTNCPIVNIKCNDMCYCEEDYARDSNGVCIHISYCPPSCGGDPNAEPGCCGQTCANYNAGKTSVCKKLCARDACQCKKGYAWDESSGKCVLPKNCPSCNVNEEYSSCTQAICRHQECSKKGQPVACPGLTPGSCLKGCVCKENFLRVKNGTCVPENLCPISDTTPTIVVKPDSQNGTNDALQALSQGLNIFCFKFFQQVLRVKKGENVIVSPLSAQIPLAQIAMAGENETKKQLLDALSLTSKDQIRQAFPLLLEALKGSNGVIFDIADKVYANKLYPLSDSFIETTQKVFNGTPENVDCSDPSGTASYINEWVESQTNKRIKNLISPDVISELTRLIIVNAIYFQGSWKEKFNENNTKPQDFYTYDKRTVSVPMMNIETRMEYTKDETLNAQVVRLYYTDSNYSFVIVLPNDRYGFDQTVAKLNADTMQAALGNLYKTKVNLYMPTMEINTDLGLIDVLKALNITDVFDPAKSDLRGIFEKYQPSYVTAAIQKAFFKCNENGTEAAAATAIIVGATSALYPPPENPIVRCDHPFLFMIYVKNNPVFIGRYQSDK